MKHIAALAVICTLTACATPLAKNQARLTISSFPEGAVIASGNVSGVSPKAVQWTLPGPTGYALVTATWMSGATRVVRLNLTGGADGTYVISRPNVPGLQTDLQYAMTLQQHNAAMHAADDAANGALVKAFADGLTGGDKPKVHCVSTRIGTIVDTDCK